jgi:squalene-hopene/tetraprenyl-beta-curcumene cyclase
MQSRDLSKGIVLLCFIPCFFAWCAIVQAPPKTLDPALADRASEATTKALAYLVASQAADGGWEVSGKSHPAISALVIRALAEDSKYGPNHPSVRRGLEYVLKFSQPDGGIYREDDGHKNYHTSVALMMLASLKDPAHRKAIAAAQDFLKKLQWDEGEGYESNSPWYGGQGYGRNKRPDLSNTQMMIEALHDSGLPADDPAYKKALVFIQRCQMLGTTNDQPFATGADDGGFIYTPANGGESMAGTETSGNRPRLRSYGSMTYAAFKSMLYAKLDRDDPRVKAAIDWIRRNYTLEHNPNMPGAQSKEGLYYYYYVFARAMQAWGEEAIKDAGGVPHSWRNELANKLLSLQRPDGSWFNDADRWYESNPYLVTAYAVLAMQTITNRPL